VDNLFFPDTQLIRQAPHRVAGHPGGAVGGAVTKCNLVSGASDGHVEEQEWIYKRHPRCASISRAGSSDRGMRAGVGHREMGMTNRRRDLLTFAAVAPIVAVSAGCERIDRIDNPGELVEHPLRSAVLPFPIALHIPRGVRARTRGDENETWIRIGFLSEHQLNAALNKDWESVEAKGIEEQAGRVRGGKAAHGLRGISISPSRSRAEISNADGSHAFSDWPLSRNGFRYKWISNASSNLHIFHLLGEEIPLSVKGLVATESFASQPLSVIDKFERLILDFWEARTAPRRPIKGVL
jgi:hypothetical protein